MFMFCPVCKYEFRRGFTHCNQCDADLIDALPPEPTLDHSAPAPTLDQPTLLWSGASGGVYSALTLALDEAHIPYNKEELDARLVFTSQHTALEVWVPAAYLSQAQPILDAALANPLNSDAAQNHYIVDEDDDGPPNDADESPDESNEGADDIRTEDVARQLYPEDATAEVWSGVDESMANILKSCLAEIGIACYIQHADSDDDSESGYERDTHLASKSHSVTALTSSRVSFDSSSGSGSASNSDSSSAPFAVRVRPEDQSRAAEIVRQITTAAPPE